MAGGHEARHHRLVAAALAGLSDVPDNGGPLTQ